MVNVAAPARLDATTGETPGSSDLASQRLPRKAKKFTRLIWERTETELFGGGAAARNAEGKEDRREHEAIEDRERRLRQPAEIANRWGTRFVEPEDQGITSCFGVWRRGTPPEGLEEQIATVDGTCPALPPRSSGSGF